MRLAIFSRLLLLALAVLPAACQAPYDPPVEPTVVLTPVVHDVFYLPGAVLPSTTEEKELHRFVQEHNDDPSRQVTLAVTSAADPLAQQRVDGVTALLHKQQDMNISVVEDPSVPQNRLRVTGSIGRLGAPDCPNWRDMEHFSNYGNSAFPNFGCAHAHNFAQVLENENDYFSPTGRASPDARRSSEVLRLYREIAPEGQVYNYQLQGAGGGS